MGEVIFEKSKKGRRTVLLPALDVPAYSLPSFATGDLPPLPEVAEIDLVRHYSNMSRLAYGVDNGFYPLGSCTMKYNPKVNEKVASLPGFCDIHPLQPADTAKGCLKAMNLLQNYLCEITGMDAMTLQPSAGAHGEFVALMMIKAYFEHKGETKRTKVIVPDSAHGTNPASAAMCGFSVVGVDSNADGNVDIDALKKILGDDCAALMLTNPNTLGLFEKDIEEIARLAHEVGALLYYDGANMNAIMGVTRPGDMGFDVVHLNLHKTFSTPHGGGGPGSGPVGCKAHLAQFLPSPTVSDDLQFVYNKEFPVKVRSFYGNFLVCIKALTYIISLGGQGLKEASQVAVLNANYMMHNLKNTYDIPYDKYCMHEFVLSIESLHKETGVSAGDIAKNLIDNDMHPPTMYFPLIVHEALMLEPTETESRETLDRAIQVFKNISDEAHKNPDELKKAPRTTPVSRIDEVRAARNPIVHCVKK